MDNALMTTEDFQATLNDFSRQSFVLGARSFASYLLRMRLEMHERRLAQIKAQGPALINNRIINADNDLKKYKGKLQIALEALLEDVDDFESIEEMEEEIRNSAGILDSRIGV